MNAYELADELDRVLQVSGCDNRVPRMLRYQADKIAELEEVVDLLSANLLAAVGKNLMKELTDEEVREIATEHIHLTLGGERFGYLEFARAIIKKVSEK